jgi:hypothetical protein
MEQACSNIAMQRIVDTHTNYMVRAGPKCKMDEISRHWSASALETLRTPIRIPERGGLQGMDRAAVTTYRLPLNHGAPSPSKVFVHPGTTPVYKETTHIPSGLQPYESTSIGHGQTQRNDKPPP